MNMEDMVREIVQEELLNYEASEQISDYLKDNLFSEVKEIIQDNPDLIEEIVLDLLLNSTKLRQQIRDILHQD